MKFWNRLTLHRCSHRFSWPRIDEEGRHYQICLLCGVAYEYDWNAMQRTKKLMVPVVQPHDASTSPSLFH